MVELPDLARRLLEGKNFATVATLMADGGPQATVVWIDTDGAHVVFNTAGGAGEAAQHAARPRGSPSP